MIHRFLLSLLLATQVGCATLPPPTNAAQTSTPTGAVLAVAAELQPKIEVAFSPEGGAEALVLKVIDGSAKYIRLAGYSFTSPAVVKALLAAKRRGVDVKVLIDDKGNRSKASLAAMNLITGADIPLRVISTFAIHHDNYIEVDGLNTEAAHSISARPQRSRIRKT